MAETLELLKAEAIDQIRADLEATVQASADAAADDAAQTALDRVSTGEDVVAAGAARDAAEDAVQYDYLVADDAARGTITGMVSGERAYIRSTEHVWLYNGSAWVDQGLSVTSAKADKAYVDDSLVDIRDELSVTLIIGHTADPIPDASGSVSTNVFVIAKAVEQSGAVNTVRVNSANSGTLNLSAWSKSGNDFTRQSEVSVAVVAGMQTLTGVGLTVNAGEYLGFYGPTLVETQAGVPADDGGWYVGGAGVSSFNDDAPTTSTRLSISFDTTTIGRVSELEDQLLLKADKSEITELVGGGTYRPNSVDLPWENMLVVGMGQSLWEGSNGDVTTAVEYDNKGFPAYPTTPNAIADATVANTERSGTRGEWPGLGAASFIRASLLRENNLSFEDLKNTVVVANNAVSGQRIDQINKGTAPFASAVAQAGALAGVADESGGVLAVTFGQGESDSQAGTDPATYLAALIQLAKDADADLRAASGQTKRIPTVVYQMNGTGRAIGLAHLQASIDSPLIYCAGPMYPYEYYDTLHINAASSRLVGAKHGEVIKKVAIDGEEWEPLRPIDAKVLGNAITLTFSKSGLVLDTTLLPAQTNSGFVVKNAAGTAQTVSAVEVVNGNQVRLTCGTTPASDWTVEYGVAAAGRSDAFTGKMGNLRDNAGAEVVFDGVPLHNWCVVFDWML